MLVRELIDILNDQPPDSEVELAIIAPIEEEADDITVDRYSVEGILPWDEHAGAPAEDGTWLIDRLNQKYLGSPVYKGKPGEVRVNYEITVVSIGQWG